MILVDAMNVIGSRPDGWWRDRDGAGRRLVAALEGWVGEEGNGVEVAVVFDGRPFPVASERVRLCWASRAGRDAADDDIAAMVEGSPDPAAITVVTSDAGLTRRVRAAGARVEGVGAFRRRVGF